MVRNGSKKAAAAGIAIVFASSLVAQVTWRRSYGAFADEQCVAARVVTDDLFVAVGVTGSFGNGSSDIYLMATDGNGDRLWSRTIGGPQVEQPSTMRVCSNGDLLIAGTTTGEGGYDGLLLRTDGDGNVLWSRTYGGDDWDFFHDVKELPDGGLLVAGESYSYGEPGANAWLLRMDAAGDTLWTRTFGGSGGHEAHSAIQALDGGFVLAGSLLTTDRDRDVLVVKVDASGATEWIRTHGGDSLDIARDILIAPNGGYSLVGSTRSFSVWTEGYHLKLFDDGTFHWDFHWGQVNDREFNEHIVLPDGEYQIAGYTKGFGGGGKDMILQRATINGGYIYGYTFGGTEDDLGSSVDLISNGALVGGATKSYGEGGWDFFLVRTGADGLTASESVQGSFDPLSVEEMEGSARGLTTYPNPNSGTFSIDAPESVARVELLDATGRSVWSHSLMVGVNEVTSAAQNGIYMLRVHFRNGTVLHSNVIIARP
jgi:hypothetical protein